MYRILFPLDNPLSIPSPCKHYEDIASINDTINTCIVYHLDEKKARHHLIKFKKNLKDELPKKMWKDLQPDLGMFAEDQKMAMEKRIVDVVRDCTDNFFEVCQRSFLSPPFTPSPSEKPEKEAMRKPLEWPGEATLGLS